MIDQLALQLGEVSKLKWQIFKLGDNNTVGLDFDSLSTNSIDEAKFNIGGGLFSGLAAGSSLGSGASLNTS